MLFTQGVALGYYILPFQGFILLVHLIFTWFLIDIIILLIFPFMNSIFNSFYIFLA